MSDEPQANDKDGNKSDSITGNNGSNKRKRTVGISSRGVANLTPEQLERKRANDREAQRAIRERTKSQIDRLNARIAELESSQPYQELRAVIAQKDAVQAENDEIKRQLGTVISIIQRFVSAPQGLEELAAAAERNAILYMPSEQPHALAQEQDPFPHHALPEHDHGSPGEAPSVGSPGSHSSMNRPFLFTTHPSHNTRPWLPTSPGAHFDQSSRNIHPDLAYPESDERLGVDFLLDNNRNRTKELNGDISPVQSTPSENSGHWSALPRKSNATCPLDAILMDAVSERQRVMNQGHTRREVAGPTYPNFNALLNKHTSYASHPISKVFTDILRTFPDLATLPEQVGVIYIMFLMMRWEVDPSKDNYERLPEWVRPIPSQLFTPHPCWIDYLPWPRLRDVTIQTSPHPQFDTFFVPYTTTLSLNWPYAPNDVLLPSLGTPNQAANGASPSSVSSYGADPNEPVWRMNPAFETHLRDLRNWSLGPLFKETYPEWQNAVRIKESR